MESDGILETKIENKLNAKLSEEKIDTNTDIQKSNQEVIKNYTKLLKVYSDSLELSYNSYRTVPNSNLKTLVFKNSTIV